MLRYSIITTIKYSKFDIIAKLPQFEITKSKLKYTFKNIGVVFLP